MMSRRNGGGGIGTTLTDALLQRTGTFDGDRVSAVGAQINCIGKVPTDIAGKSRRLFLSNNSISSLRGVEQFPLLDSLSVAHNEIKYLEELYFLKFLTCIKKLTLVGNLVTKVPFYADFVLGHCPNLLYLDNIKISDEDRMRAKVNYRRACQYISRAITNSIRNSLLGQIVGMRLCQQDMLCSVFGRFVYVPFSSSSYLNAAKYSHSIVASFAGSFTRPMWAIYSLPAMFLWSICCVFLKPVASFNVFCLYAKLI